MAAKKNSLVGNINKRKKAGTSRPKSRSHVSKEAYAEMEAGWPHAKKKRATKKRATRSRPAAKR